MRNAVRWEPFDGSPNVRPRGSRFLDAGLSERAGWLTPLGGGDLAVDMFETDDDLVVSTALPGVKPEDVDISLTGDTLCIAAETKAQSGAATATYYQQERRYGACGRTLILPVAVQVEKADAKFKDGVLTLTLPKAEAAKPHAIKVTAVAK